MRATLPLLLVPLLAGCARLELVEELDSFTGRPLYRGFAERHDGALLAQSDWVFWHKNGRMLARGAFRDAPLLSGRGEVLPATIPSQGRDGPWTFWSADGQIRAQGAYRAGLMSGLWTCWYKNGQRCWMGSYAAGLPEGHHVRWNAAGVKVEECGWAHGLLEGERRLWSDDGELVCVEVYERGRRVRAEGLENAPPPELASLYPLDEELEELLVLGHAGGISPATTGERRQPAPLMEARLLPRRLGSARSAP